MNGARSAALLPAALLLALAGCSVPVKVPEIPILEQQDFAPARTEEEPAEPPRSTVEIPTPLPLPGQLKPVEAPAEPPKDDGPPTERIDQANKAARVEPAKDGYINAIQTYPYAEGALYQVYAAVSQVTEIALEPGEKLVSFSSGDTLRWVVGDTTSGEGASARVHLLMKPVHPGLQTNGLITTDRRSYHLNSLHAKDLHGVGLVDLSGVGTRGPEKQGRGGRSFGKGHRGADIDLSRCVSATASRAMRPGNRAQVFDDGPRSTSSFPQVWHRARRRRCS